MTDATDNIRNHRKMLLRCPSCDSHGIEVYRDKDASVESFHVSDLFLFCYVCQAGFELDVRLDRDAFMARLVEVPRPWFTA